MEKKLAKAAYLLLLCAVLSLPSCKKNNARKHSGTQAELERLLENQSLNPVSRYAIVNRMATNLLTSGDSYALILFLTDWVENHPDDLYNSYWLLMTAYAYLKTGAEPVAEYYFDHILRGYQDLLVKENSIHFLCLQNLIQISKSPYSRIIYMNELIDRFASRVSVTELYLRLALEYEKENEWDAALRSYKHFLAEPDSSTIQIAGEPNAYKKARHIIGFSASEKNWTFESLSALENAVKKAIERYDWRTLDSYKAKVNFFSMSWKQDEMDPKAQEAFSMKKWMRGNRVQCNAELDEDSNSDEAYLRTWGWNQYVPTWYLYFRKVNFPLDPDIHGNWEWAGIYMGEKL